MALANENPWYVYLIRDASGSLYCGITTDVNRRFNQHVAGKGAKYFRGRHNLDIVWQQIVQNRSIASRIESYIKQLPKPKKEALIANNGEVVLDPL